MDDNIEMRARMRALETQRNRALMDHAVSEGSLSLALARIEELMVQIKELSERLEKMSPKENV